MSTGATNSKSEADFRFWTLLLVILAGGRPIEDILCHREFQSRGKRICAGIMHKYYGIMRMYYGASYDEGDLFSEACTRMVNFWHARLATNNAPDGNSFPTEDAFFGWFFTLALNIIRSKLRKFKELRKEGITLIHVPIDDLFIAIQCIQPECENFLSQFLEFTETLPAKRRRAMHLWYEGYSTREIKTILNGEDIKCSNVTVQNWTKAGLKAFVKSLKRGQGGINGL